MEYILDNKPIFYKQDKEYIDDIVEKLSSNIKLTPREIDDFLKYCITYARIIVEYTLDIDMDDNPMINMCDFCQRICGNIFEDYHLKVSPKRINNILKGYDIQDHSFLTVNIQGREYLIDIDYRQFFTAEGCDMDTNLIIVGDTIVKNVDPGFYAITSKTNNKETIYKLIEDGFIEINEQTIKDYLDPFYYSKRGNEAFINIPGDIYLKCLNKDEEWYTSSEETIKANLSFIRG